MVSSRRYPARVDLPRRLRRLSAALLLAALIDACTVGPDFEAPPAPAVDRYTREALPVATVTAERTAQRFATDATLPADWWRWLGSPELDALMQRAVRDNADLAAADARLRASEDSLRAGYGIFYPQASAGLDIAHGRSAPLRQGVAGASSVTNVTTLSATVSYALDIFGGERRNVEALGAAADYQAAGRQAVLLALSANLVEAVIARAGYAAQLQTTGHLIELQKTQLQITRAQVRAGVAPYSDMLGLEALIAANEALLPPLRQKIAHAEHLIATLAGTTPAELTPPAIDLAALHLPQELPVSLPSALVQQRPDIIAARAQLHVASANIGIATAAELPSFELNAGYGRTGGTLGDLTGNHDSFWSLGPSAALPLFRGGALHYQKQAAIDSYEAAAASYRQVVLDAFAQVADALTALQHDAELVRAQAEARRKTNTALQLAQANYRAGLAGYVDLLAADLQYQQAHLAWIEGVAQRHQDTVALLAALGGGWWNATASTGGAAP